MSSHDVVRNITDNVTSNVIDNVTGLPVPVIPAPITDLPENNSEQVTNIIDGVGSVGIPPETPINDLVQAKLIKESESSLGLMDIPTGMGPSLLKQESENMIDLTVKTLDSQNHPFHVEEELTIRQFKEKISESLNIPPDSQRLIFCGRVLQDDKKLSEYVKSGNTIHLVQRAPPNRFFSPRSPEYPPQAASRGRDILVRGGRQTATRGRFRTMPSVSIDRNARYLGAMAYPADLMEAQGIQLPQPSTSLCASRLNIARRMLRRAEEVLSYLENPGSNPPRSTPSPTTVQVSQAVIEVGIAEPEGNEGMEGNMTQAATAAVIAAVVSAAQEVGVPNISIFRGQPGGSHDETVIHIESLGQDGSADIGSLNVPNLSGSSEVPENNADISESEEDVAVAHAVETAFRLFAEDNDNDAPMSGHSRSSSSDSFSSATDLISSPELQSTQRTETNPADEGAAASSEGATGAGVTTGQPARPTSRTTLAPLASLLDELNIVQVRLQPFMTRYHTILLQDPSFSTDVARTEAQNVFNRVSQIMHLLSHAYHAISDLMVDLNSPAPRYLRCRPILIQHSAVVQAGIPLHAEINIPGFTLGSNPEAPRTSTPNAPDSPVVPESNNPVAAPVTTSAPPTTASPTTASPSTTPTPTAPTPTAPSIPVADDGTTSSPMVNGTSSTTTSAEAAATTTQARNNVRQVFLNALQGLNPFLDMPATPTTTSDTNSASAPQQPRRVPSVAFVNPRRHNFGFTLPEGMSLGGNVEVVMEVSPAFQRTFTQSATSNGATPTTGGNGMGVTIPISPPSNEVLANIMQAVAGQIINRAQNGGLGVNQARRSSSQTNASEQPENGSTAGQTNGATNQAGQNSQARVNTATHPTTSTQTRSTARPHVHLRGPMNWPMGGQLGHFGGALTSSFDPFLPCNSHHLRARRRAGASGSRSGQSSARATSEESVATSQAEQTNGEPRLRRFISRMSLPIPNEASAVEPDDDERLIITSVRSLADHMETTDNILMDLIHTVVHNIPISEILILLMANPAPLTRLAPTIREFLTRRLFDNQTPTTEARIQGSNRIIEQMCMHFSIMNSMPSSPGIDLVGSIVLLTRCRLPFILTVAMREEDSDNSYGIRLMRAISSYIRMFCAILCHCCSDGADGAENIFRRYVEYISDGADRGLLAFTMSYSAAEFRQYLNTLDVPLSEIQRFLAPSPPPPAENPVPLPESMLAQTMECDEIVSNSIEESTTSNQATTSISQPKPPLSCPMTNGIDVQASNNPQLGVNCTETPTSMMPSIEMDVDSLEPLPNVVLGSQPWHSALPPDWVPIITRDAVRQRRQPPQPPLSDAYLEGMPSKRRKLITSEKPQTDVVQVVQDGVRHAVQSVVGVREGGPSVHELVNQIGSDETLQAAYRDQMRTVIQTRLQSSDDYKPEKYPNAEKFFK